jgi:uncharacterized protein (TIGR02300 family)
MPAKDLGTKFVCFKCNTRFYDMKKPEPICPKCGADQRESPALKSPPPAEKRARAPARPVVAAAAVDEAEPVEAELDEELEEDEDADDDAAEDEDEP